MSEIEKLEKAIRAVESQRASLGDEAVDAVLEGLRQELAALELATAVQAADAGESAASGERRIVTVLFCDVKGSTALADNLDPETWAEIMNEAFDHLTEPVDRFGGTVAQLRGDGFVAYFGAPTTHEDDPQRAVLAGLAIFENVGPFRERLQRQQGMDFNLRVGINTGLVVTGTLGSKLHEGYSAMGEAVDLAATMERNASPGTVQVSEHTHKLLAKEFEFVESGLVEVGGDQAPVHTYQVVARKARPGRSRGLDSYGVGSPLTGRSSEMAIARQAVGRLVDGAGGILTFIGEAGIGKSRLVEELRLAIGEKELTWLSGQTLTYGEGISYWPFQEILRQYGGILEEDAEEVAWRKLEGRVLELFPDESAEILPYLASVMALEARGEYVERVRFLDGEAMREQILVASRRFFERLASQRPLLLAFEDLQWADASTVLLLERLLPLVERTCLLILGISRPDPNPAVAGFHKLVSMDFAQHYTEIALQPLSTQDSVQLVSHLLSDDALTGDIKEMIVRKADGNPFYMEEIVRDLIEAGAMSQERGSGRWQATSRVDLLSIPDTVQGVIRSRIDRFDDGVKEVLRSAAVIGRSFRHRLLSAALEGKKGLERQLSELQKAELIRTLKRIPELEYMFKHALAQEVTYQSILLGTRRRIHGRVGRAIENLFGDRLEEFYGLLAYHFAQAEEWEPAQSYLLKAGDQAGHLAADAEALNHYQQALKAYENAFGQDWDPLERATLDRKMGEAYYGLGKLPESREFFRSSLAHLDRPLPSTIPGLLATLVGQIWRQLFHRIWPSRFVNSAPEEKRAGLREVVRAYERLGVIFYIEGDAASSIYAFLRSLNLAEPAGPSPELARAYANNVVASGLIPPLRFMADRYSELALQTAGEGEDLAAMAWVRQLTGIYSIGVGRWTAAIEAERQAVAINERIGRLRWREESLGSLAQAIQFSGEYVESRQQYRELLTSSRERGDRQTQVWALAGLLETGLRLAGEGLLDELAGYVEEAKALLAGYRYPNRPDKIQITGASALVHLRAGQLQRAAAEVTALAELISEEWPPSTFYTFEAYAGLPAVTTALWQAQMDGRYRPGVSENLEARSRKAVRALFSFARIFPIALPRAWYWRGVTESMANKPNGAKKAWSKALNHAERLNMPFERGLVLHQMGMHLPNDDPARQRHLQEAAGIFAEAGASWELERARQAMA